LKEGLEKLYALQQLDDKSKELEISLKEIPETILKLESERDGKASIIENTKSKLKENAKGREKLEKEISMVKDKISKYKDQMGKATTNKEYQGFMGEIKYEEENITAIEEKVIEKMLESDEIMNEIRESEAEFVKISGEYNIRIKELNGIQEQNRSALAELTKDKSGVRAQIPARLLEIYDTLAQKKNGKAVSLVESEFCGVCNVKIRPQHLNELIASRGISTCESCGRLLYKKIEIKVEEKEKAKGKN
jgi:predicted  nucleic acid-binding Zn-ribbon protein